MLLESPGQMLDILFVNCFYAQNATNHIFTNPQQKNITILTDRHMIHSVCPEYPAIKTEEKKVAQATAKNKG